MQHQKLSKNHKKKSCWRFTMYFSFGALSRSSESEVRGWWAQVFDGLFQLRGALCLAVLQMPQSESIGQPRMSKCHWSGLPPSADSWEASEAKNGSKRTFFGKITAQKRSKYQLFCFFAACCHGKCNLCAAGRKDSHIPKGPPKRVFTILSSPRLV